MKITTKRRRRKIKSFKIFTPNENLPKIENNIKATEARRNYRGILSDFVYNLLLS